MAALADVKDLGVVHIRAAVVHGGGLFGKSGQHVQLCKDAAVGLDVRDALLDKAHQGGKDAGLYGEDLVFGREDFFLVVLEFLRYVALCIYQRLFAYPLRRHLVFIGVAHLNVIAENVVVGNLEGAYAGAFRLTLLHLKKVVLAAAAKGTEFVQFCIHALADDRPLANLDGGFRVHDALDFLHQGAAVLHSAKEFLQSLRAIGQPLFYGGR